MKKITLIIVFVLAYLVSTAQGTASGTGYVLSRPSGTDCSLAAANTVKFGNGTKRIEICLTTNNLVTTCGGGNNKDDQVYIYEDQNNDGTPETLLSAIVPSTANGTCYMASTSGNGYLYLLFCPAGTCDAGDKAASSITVSWFSYGIPSNDVIGGPVTLYDCTTGFSANNYNATNTGDCAGYTGNSGPPSFAVISLYNDLDCNTATAGAAAPYNGNGGDVGFSLENDIWYKFCPAITGTWQMTISKSNCYTTSGGAVQTTYGFQYSLFQGTTTNLGNVIAGGAGGDNWTITQTININVTSTANCFYLNIDGYGGTGCKFVATITPPAGICTVMPIELISFEGKVVFNQISIQWITATELNNDYFTVEKSLDAVNFTVLGHVDGNGNSLHVNQYRIFDTEPNNGVNYYRLTQTDFDGKSETFDIIAVEYDKSIKNRVVKITNVLGQEINENVGGVVFYYFEDGTVIKTFKVIQY